MKLHSYSVAGVVATLFSILQCPALAWDAAGHMLVDEIAWEQTKPAARAKVSALVATLETTYNEGQAYNFITAGCWMDDMRAKKGYEWSKWHYVDAPYTPSGAPFTIPAEGPHIVWAIEQNLATLRNPASTPAEQSLAVAMLMHFVGDIHQPLHATDWNDRGGNGFLIAGVTFTDLVSRSAPNLHTLWDKGFRFTGRDGANIELWQSPGIAARPKAAGEGVIATEAAKIIAAFPSAGLPELAGPQSAAMWARESHTIGCLAGYPLGPHPSDHEVVTLAPEFISRTGQIAQMRVAAAGYRLAALLNDLFASDAK